MKENRKTREIEQCAPEDCASCSADCSSNQDLNQPVIEITTDEGTVMRCLIVLKYRMEQNSYIAVMPLKENPDGDIFLFRLVKDGTALDNIEDEEEYARAAKTFGIEMENREKAKAAAATLNPKKSEE